MPTTAKSVASAAVTFAAYEVSSAVLYSTVMTCVCEYLRYGYWTLFDWLLSIINAGGERHIVSTTWSSSGGRGGVVVVELGDNEIFVL